MNQDLMRASRIVLKGHEGGLLPVPAGMDASALVGDVLRATTECPQPVVTLGKSGVRLGNVVGAISAGPIQLEILPKLSSSSSEIEDREFLLDLLNVAGLSPRLFATHGGVRTDSPVLLESVIEQGVGMIASLLVSGPPRRYSLRRDESTALRGKLDMTRLALRRPGRDDRLPISHYPLQRDNSLSRLVVALLSTLKAMTRSTRVMKRIVDAQRLCGDVKMVPLGRALAKPIVLNRYEQEWAEVVEFASMILKGLLPNVVGVGDFAFTSLVFPLSDLFEAVIRRSLPEALAGSELQIASSGGSLRLLRSIDDGREALLLRPDYYFVGRESGREGRLVADAKWKRLDRTKRGLGMQPADVYQCATYMTRHNLDRGALFYPRSEWMGDPMRPWVKQYALVGGSSRVMVIGVDFPGLVARSERRRREALAQLAESVEAAAA